jgi:hypothetical protein
MPEKYKDKVSAKAENHRNKNKVRQNAGLTNRIRKRSKQTTKLKSQL